MNEGNDYSPVMQSIYQRPVGPQALATTKTRLREDKRSVELH